MSALKTARSFVEAINCANIEKLSGLMSTDHTFIDTDGSENSGSQKMRESWADYFKMVPDYKIKISDTFTRKNIVVLVGTAEGTFIEKGELRAENHWKVPAAWRVEIKEDKVSVWQLFTNQEIIVRIYNRLKQP